MKGAPAQESLRFGPGGRFELQALERRLLVDGEPAPLGSRAFDLLLELASRPGQLRSKHELIEAVWPGVVVEEGNLATQISSLRKVLGGEVIATVPGRGYRFAGRLAPADKGGLGTGFTGPSTLPEAETKLRTNLPHGLPALLGRTDDLALLGELIDQHPLVSIVGPGGMGKSLLTQHLLDSRRQAYRHGVCWVELGTVTEPALLPGVVAAALGVQAGRNDALAGLCHAVAPLQMLVALDNAEQVLDGVAELAAALTQAAPGLRVVVTSQATLRLAQEQVFRVGPLAVPGEALPAAEALAFSAVALFVERARQADHRFALTDALAPAVIETCRALDGLPLAIELAAARLPLLGAQQLASSMPDRLKLLTRSGNRVAPPRQQTLRATLEWSHGFLEERERIVFRRLAVVSGTASLSVIQQVVADRAGEGDLDKWSALDALALLVDRSLVNVVAGNPDGEPRYRLLDSPRAFAVEQLRSAGEEPAVRLRHLRAVAALCEAAWHARFSGEIGWQDWQRAMELDSDNARDAMAAAVASGERVSALRIGVVRLRTSADMPMAERQQLAEQCIAQLDAAVPLSLQVRTWIGISWAVSDSRLSRVQEAARKALELLQSSPQLQDDRFLCYLAWCQFAIAADRGSASADEIQAALRKAGELEDSHWPPHRRGWRALAEYQAMGPDSPEARRRIREVLSLELAAGGNGHTSRSNLIDVDLGAGDAEAAARTGETLLAELQGSRGENNLAFTRLNLAAACLALDDVNRVRSLAQAGWRPGRRLDHQAYWADYLALLAALEGRPRAAAQLAGYAEASYAAREDNREPNEATAHSRACTLARAALGDAEFERLNAEGRLLGDEQVEAIAFEPLPTQPMIPPSLERKVSSP